MSAEDNASIGGGFYTSTYIKGLGKGLGMAGSYIDFCVTNASFFVGERKLTRCRSAASGLRPGGQPVSQCTAGWYAECRLEKLYNY
jgi:hypothetical protein